MRNCISALKIFGDIKMYKVAELVSCLYNVAAECVSKIPPVCVAAFLLVTI